MNHLPLTRSQPFTDFPAGMDPLFDELAPLVQAPVEVTVTVPEGDRRRCVMDLLVAEGDAVRAFAVAWEKCGSLAEFEITVRRFDR
jgi:hypothetical protein